MTSLGFASEGSVAILLRQLQRDLLEEASLFHTRCVLPLQALDWLLPGMPSNTASSGVLCELLDFKTKAQAVLDEVVSAGPTLSAGAIEKIRERNAILKSVLAGYDPDGLALSARNLHLQIRGICDELESQLQRRSAESCAPAASMTQQVNSSKLLKLSDMQQQVIECPFSIFLQGRSGTGKTAVLVRRMVKRQQDAFAQEAQHIPSQIFVTKSQMLKDNVALQLRHAGFQSYDTGAPIQSACLTWRQFATTLCDIFKLRTCTASINYERFLTKYWPSLRMQSRELPPLFVWTEFSSRLRPFGHENLGLSLEEYLQNNMGAMGARLCRADQKAIHDMFLQYTAAKRIAHELDDNDVVSILHEEWSKSHKLVYIDEVYIDEAQDFTPAELTLMLSLCRDPNGIHVAGDTCQTINPGSAFCFKEIYQAFCLHGGQVESRLQPGVSEEKRLVYKGEAKKSKKFALKYNYRSSQGVVALANSVVGLLRRRFPHCADWIQEQSVFESGSMPLFLELCGVSPSCSIMGSGPHKIDRFPSRVTVLVRSSTSRDRLRRSGVSGTVLTIAEAKGLEFDIVILCGLLTDCPDAGEFCRLADDDSRESRVAASVVNGESLLYGHGARLQLSDKNHALLCHTLLAIPEWKALYVAITRARYGCALLEFKVEPDVWKPLVSLWQHSRVVEHWSGPEEYSRNAAKILNKAPDTHRSKYFHPLACVLEKRFCDDLDGDFSADVETLRDNGQKLLTHALDNLQEFWAVCGEARRAFLRAMSTLELMLKVQLINGGRRVAPVIAAPVSVVEGQACPTASASVVWRQCLCIVLQEACRSRSCSSFSSLSIVRSLVIWELIFSFLAPPTEVDVRNTLGLVAERVVEHARLRHDLRCDAMLAHAHHLCGQARYDLVWQSHEQELRLKVTVSIRLFWSDFIRSQDYRHARQGRFLQSSVCAALRASLQTDAFQSFEELQILLLSRVDDCAYAGQSFLALGASYSFAADAFAQAARIAGTIPALIQEHWLMTCLPNKSVARPGSISNSDVITKTSCAMTWNDSLLGQFGSEANVMTQRTQRRFQVLQKCFCGWLRKVQKTQKANIFRAWVESTDPLRLALRVWRVRSRKYWLRAAYCFLSNAAKKDDICADALMAAGAAFAEIGRHWEAALCLAQAGQVEDTLKMLRLALLRGENSGRMQLLPQVPTTKKIIGHWLRRSFYIMSWARGSFRRS